MKPRILVCLSLVLSCVPAFALTIQDEVTPQWTKENGITVKTALGKNGTITFTVTRYLDKASNYGNNPELLTRRGAHLELRSATDVVLSTNVSGETGEGVVVYEFAVAPDALKSTQFSFSEWPEYRDTKKVKLVMGGHLYAFDLNAFAAPLIAAQHP